MTLIVNLKINILMQGRRSVRHNLSIERGSTKCGAWGTPAPAPFESFLGIPWRPVPPLQVIEMTKAIEFRDKDALGYSPARQR
jgi:hypothetical protein